MDVLYEVGEIRRFQYSFEINLVNPMSQEAKDISTIFQYSFEINFAFSKNRPP
jgi:hypothetical protein